MENSEPKVVRIVNLDKDSTNQTLKILLKEQVYLRGNIEETYIRQDKKSGLYFAYVIFEFSCDAKMAKKELNGFQYHSLELDVAVIAPESGYKEYIPSTEKLQAPKLFKVSNCIFPPKYMQEKQEINRGSQYSANRWRNYPFRNSSNSLVLSNTLAKKNVSSLEKERSLDLDLKRYAKRFQVAAKPKCETKNKLKLNQEKDRLKKTSSKLATKLENTNKDVPGKNASIAEGNAKSKQKRGENAKKSPNKLAQKSEINIKDVIEKNVSMAQRNAKFELNQKVGENVIKTSPKLASKSGKNIKDVTEKIASTAGKSAKWKLNQNRGKIAKKSSTKLHTLSENLNKNIPEKKATTTEVNAISKLNLKRVGNKKVTPKSVTKSENTIQKISEQNSSMASKSCQKRRDNLKIFTPKLVSKSENTIKIVPEKNHLSTAEHSKYNSKVDNGLKTPDFMRKPLIPVKDVINTILI